MPSSWNGASRNDDEREDFRGAKHAGLTACEASELVKAAPMGREGDSPAVKVAGGILPSVARGKGVSNQYAGPAVSAGGELLGKYGRRGEAVGNAVGGWQPA
jgi:hypothetical protein